MISYRLYDKLGHYQTPAHEISTSYSGEGTGYTAVDELSNDDYFVVWEEGRSGLYGRYIDGDGTIRGSNDLLISGQGQKYATCEISNVYSWFWSQVYETDTDVAMVVWNEIIDGLDDDNAYGRMLALPWDEEPSVDHFITIPFHLDNSIIGGDYEEDAQAEVDGIKLPGDDFGYFASSWIYNQPYEQPTRSSLSYNAFNDLGDAAHAVPPEFDPQGFISGLHMSPAVTIDTDKRITIAWADYKDQIPTVRAQQFDFEGNVTIDQVQVNSSNLSIPTRGIESVKIKSFANNDFIIVWEAYDATNPGDVLLYAKRYGQAGNLLDTNEFAITGTDGNASKPTVDTQRDKFYVAWNDDRLIDGEDKGLNIFSSIWACHDQAPTLLTGEIPSQAILWDDIPQEGVLLGSEVTDGGARINAGIDTVYFHEHWSWNIGGLAGVGNADEAKPAPYPENVYWDRIPKSQLRRATRARFYVEAVDRAVNRSWDIPGNPQNPNDWWKFYISRRGDLDVDGYISDNDAYLLCLNLQSPEGYPLDPWEEVFADWDGDGTLEWADYYSILNNMDEPYPDRAPIPLGDIQDEIEMGVGYGAAGSTGRIVPVYIANDSTYISNVTYAMEYDEGILSLDQKMTTGRTQYFTFTSPCVIPEKHLDLYGGDSYSISPGNGPVTNLSFSVAPDAPQGSYHITLTRGDLADSSGVAVPHLKMRGKFFVGTPPPVSIVCSPLSDTTLERGDTLTFHTVLKNHSWQGFTASVFMYGTVTPDSMNPFLVVDTTYVYLPPNARIASITELEAPQYAPLTHYEFTGYVGQAQTLYDSDKFGFDIVDSLGMSEGGGQLMSQVTDWRLLSGWFGTKTGEEEVEIASPSIPKAFSLSQNYPNPFNPTTTIQYSIPEGFSNREIRLVIFNVRGQVVRNIDLGINKVPGVYSYTWDGHDDRGVEVSSGIYLYRLMNGSKSITKRMLLLR